MLYRYNLKVGLNGKEVFNGNFSSINQMVKVSCSFSHDCVLEAFDCFFKKLIPIYTLMSEFENDVTGI